MKIDGKEFAQRIDVNDRLSAYHVYFCEEYISAVILWKESERNSKQIGHLTCLNHPSKDGTNPHWQIIVEINKSDEDKIGQIHLKQFVEALRRNTPIKDPIWIELRESKSIAHSVIGDLWNDD